MTTTKTIASIMLTLILTASIATDAAARSRKNKVKPKSDDRVIALLQRVIADNAKLQQRVIAAEVKLSREIAEFNKRLRPDNAPVISADTPLPPRNPLAAIAPMPLPDVSRTLGGYREHVSKIPPATTGLGNIRGLQKNFVGKLATMQADMPDSMRFSVGSGFRTRAQQARLYARKPHLAARPGRSWHEKGLAGDLRFSSVDAKRWVHRNARRYGLRFPIAYEPWHIEPDGLTRSRYARGHRRYAAVQ